MGTDVWLVLQWWVALFVVGAVAYPLTKRLFAGWFDRGYLFSKAVGMAVVGFLVYVFGTLHLLAFTKLSIYVSLAVLFILGLLVKTQRTKLKLEKSKMLLVLGEEIFFLVALFFWSWIKGHEPSIESLEKFMDFGFMNSILHSRFFPPADMWYPPYPINYYYFGHLVTAVLTKLSGLDLTVTFNLMLATIFAFTFTMSFSLGYQLAKLRGKKDQKWGIPPVSGLLTAFLVTLAGNMQTIYAFTKGYTGDAVAPFWQLLWPLGQFWQKLPEGLQTYWYANATRFIPYAIHEFPSYSFVVSDVHGHVLSIPFVLVTIGLLLTIYQQLVRKEREGSWLRLIFYGFLVGALLMTNALDGPIYLGLLIIVLGVLARVSKTLTWKEFGMMAALVTLVGVWTSLPFLAHFKSFVNGIAVDCPPVALANTKFGPILMEGVEKCQKSPLWMMWVLWGFFWFCGVFLVLTGLKRKASKFRFQFRETEMILVVFFVFSLLLTIFPEFFYFKDIYPMHFRSNTMFKLGYQAFILFSLVSGYTIVQFFGGVYKKEKWLRKIFIILLIPQLFLVSIFPIFSVRSYFNSLRNYTGISGLGWLEQRYPDDYLAIQWFQYQPYVPGETLVEADGDSYTDYERFSVFTGRPTIIGWAVHEWLWRGSYDAVAPRRTEVGIIYESPDIEATKQILTKYNVRYIIVGALEREKFKGLNEEKFSAFAKPVYRTGQTVIYQVKNNLN